MKRMRRILVEVLLPPLLGGAIFSVHMVTSRRDLQSVSEIPLLIGFAYLYAFIPSVVYSVLMEVGFSAGLSARSWKAVLLSLVLGGFAGLSIILVTNRVAFRFIDSLPLVAIGVAVGFVVGVIIRSSSRPNEKPA